MFQRIAGPQTTFATVVFGEVLDGEAAEKAGLVWRCVPDDELLPTAREMAGRALNAPVELVKKITATIREIPADRRPSRGDVDGARAPGVVDRAAPLPGDAGGAAREDQLPRREPTARRHSIRGARERHQGAERFASSTGSNVQVEDGAPIAAVMPATSHIESLGSYGDGRAPRRARRRNHPIGGRVVIVDRHALVAQSLAMVLATASVTTFIATRSLLRARPAPGPGVRPRPRARRRRRR